MNQRFIRFLKRTGKNNIIKKSYEVLYNIWKNAKTPKTYGKYHCNICDSDLTYLIDNGISHEFFSRHSVIGGGYRKHCVCPVCGSGDRQRFIYYYLKNHTNILAGTNTILHIAPEIPIANIIRSNKNAIYHTGDIEPGRADYVVDITDIQFADETYDYIICNHVLEHIIDEKRAFHELMRILKKDGTIILSVPVSISDDETYENNNIVTPKERLRHFGQEDHVRLYGNDIIERWEKYGLKILEFNSAKDMDKEIVEKYGLIVGDRVYICKKC